MNFDQFQQKKGQIIGNNGPIVTAQYLKDMDEIALAGKGFNFKLIISNNYIFNYEY